MTPLDVGSRRQLFIDNRFVAASSHVSLTPEQPEVRAESLLSPLRPWEAGRAGAWASLLHHEGRFHLYDGYQWDEESRHIARETHAHLYAVSNDGQHFEKPSLDLFVIDGSGRNNACMRSIEGGSVFIDPLAPEQRRFRFIGRSAKVRGCNWDQVEGIDGNHTWMFTSPDGVRWRRNREPLLRLWLGATQSAVWDGDLGTWVLFLRAHVLAPNGVSRRAVARTAVADLDQSLALPASPESASSAHAFLSDELPIVLDVDEDDPPGAQIYVGNITRYARAQDVYLAFPPIWYDRRSAADASDKVEVQLAVSRDGISWQRPWRQPLIAPGVLGAASAGQIFPVPDPVIVGDEIWLYFTAMAEDHMSEVSGSRQSPAGAGRVAPRPICRRRPGGRGDR